MLRRAVHLRGPGTANQSAVTVRQCVYSFGGNKDHIDVHVFSTVSLTWRKLIPVTPGRALRFRPGLTAVLIENTVYLWGGYCNVLYAFDVDAETWFKPQVSGTVPEGRYRHSACVLGKVMFIHGGDTQTRHDEYTNDIYKLDTTTMVWTSINTKGTQTPASWGHSATIIGTKMFVFGGMGTPWNWNTFLNTRVFDTETNHWLSTPSKQRLPEERCCHSAFTYNEELYIFGGWNRKQNFYDMWKFNPETSWKKVEPKGEVPSLMFITCCCMVGDRVILIGVDNNPDDLYVLDFSPSLKTLCKLAVIQYGLDHSELPHNIRWELAAMTAKN